MSYNSKFAQNGSRMTRPGSGPAVRRRDIKERTMNRFVALDGDIASRYDNDDDEGLPIYQKSKMERQVESINRDIRGRNSRIARNQVARSAGGRRDLAYRVTIRNGGRGDVDFVMQSLSELVGNFVPFNISEDPNRNVTFFVYTLEEADNIKMLNRRLFHPSEPKAKFLIYHNQQPSTWESLDSKIKLAIRDVVKSRYNAATNSVDLSQFQSNKIFTERDLRSLCSLTRNAVLVEVIRATAEYFPTITGLSLKGNRLSQLNYLQSFTYACPDVIELDLSDNALDSVDELKKIRQWGIQRIFLENNPLSSAFSDASSYTSAVQDFLPKINFLDGMNVDVNPHKVKADMQRRSGILHPPVQAPYFPDKGLKQRVEQLLIQFYDIYDGKPCDKTRQALFNAYDEDATFTYAIYTLHDRDNKQVRRGDDEAYTQYIRSSHNLCQEEKWERYRDKIVYKGSMAIAVALSQLPQTEHDKNSFQLEFITVRNNILIFTLRGILRDGADVNQPSGNYKFFIRTFTVVPKGEEKMAIVNDDLILTPITQERLEKYTEQLKKMAEVPDDPQPQPGPSGLLMNNGMSMAGPSGIQDLQRQQLQQMQPIGMQDPVPQAQIQQQQLPYDRNDPAIRQAMMETFSKQSGMKPEWAQKCLEDTQWDFEAAGIAFNNIRHQIPPEAFL